MDSTQKLIEDMEWRHACKAMNGKSVDQKKIDTILEAINLTPTSLGLQAFKVLVVKGEKLKNEIFEKTCQQQPVKSCSHLLIFASNKAITPAMLDEYFELIRTTRHPSDEWLAKYRNKIGSFMGGTPEMVEEWLARQVYIAMGSACIAAAAERVESVPIEGFNAKGLDELLGLDKKGLKSVLLFPVGYRDPEADWLGTQAKVRKPLSEIVENLD